MSMKEYSEVTEEEAMGRYGPILGIPREPVKVEGSGVVVVYGKVYGQAYLPTVSHTATALIGIEIRDRPLY